MSKRTSPYLAPTGLRTENIGIRVTSKEKRELRKLAKLDGRSLSEYAREILRHEIQTTAKGKATT